MFQTFVSTMLGPFGNKILQWYVENNLYVNGFIVLVGIIAAIAPRKAGAVQSKFRQLWAKTPLALSEKDRLAVDAAYAKRSKKNRRAK